MKVLAVFSIGIIYLCLYLLVNCLLEYNLYIDFILALSIGFNLYQYVFGITGLKKSVENKIRVLSLSIGTLVGGLLFILDWFHAFQTGLSSFFFLQKSDDVIYTLLSFGVIMLASHIYILFSFFYGQK